MTVPDASPPLSTDSRLGAGRYRLVRPLAQGGMAAVWEGYDEILARSVAIKILHPHLAADQTFLERFRHEAVAAARLSHPNVVATYDAGMAGTGTAFIVMELVRGPTLRQYLSEQGPLSPPLTVAIGVQIADALVHAHAAGLIHRDVKPGNVLIDDTEIGQVPRVKVTDFGIAKAAEGLGTDLTRTGMVMGTPRYLSPEQIEGGEPDARADLYALGVVLFEMLTGRPPFAGPTDMATAVQHLNTTAPHVRQFQPSVPPSLDDLVDRLLAKRPDDRPASSGAVRQALLAADTQSSRWDGPAPSSPANGTRPTDGSHSGGGLAPTGVQGANPVGWTPSPPGGSGTTALLSSGHSPESTSMLPGGTSPPAAGPPPPAALRPGRPRRANWPGRIVALLAAVALIVVIVVVASNGSSKKHPKGLVPTSPTSSAPVAVTISSVSVFHLERDGEHANMTPLTFDGNLDTGWTSDHYYGPNFGNLRRGLGLAITINGDHKVHQLKVYSPTDGWSAQVYVASAIPDPPAMGPWGRVVDSRQGASAGWTTFNLNGADGSRILLWITDLGPSFQTSINELRLS